MAGFFGFVGHVPYQTYYLAPPPPPPPAEKKKEEEKKEKEPPKEYILWDQEAYDKLHAKPEPAPAPAAVPQPIYCQAGFAGGFQPGFQAGFGYMPGPGYQYPAHGAYFMQAPEPAAAPAPAPVPEEPKALPTSISSQFWCRELDGSWTQRSGKDIGQDCQPGKWEYAEESGYPIWIRAEKKD